MKKNIRKSKFVIPRGFKKNEKVLVTGGAGFIGSHLVDLLVEGGCKVAVIDDLSGGKREYVNAKCDFYKCDLRRESRADKIISSFKPDVVYHLAANAAEMKAQFSPIDISSRNYSAFINVLVSALRAGMRRMVFTSSIAVYGKGQVPFKESDKPEPEDIYGITKLAIEETLKVLSKVHGFEYVIVRPHNVYGPRQNMTDPYRNVVMIFMNVLLGEKPCYIYGDGEQRRCFSYIGDVINAIYRCGFDDVNEMIFNIGSDGRHSINELFKIIQEVSGILIKPKYLIERPQEVKIAVSQHSLAKKYLDYEDKISLREGIEKTWDYVKKMGYQKPVYTKVELESSQLPSNWRVE